MTMKRLLLALLLCLLGSTPAWAAHPALWRVRDADTTIYLFGTVHVMPTGVQWHFPALDKALKKSRVLYVEVANTDPAHVTPLALKYGLDPSHPLSDKLSDKENALLKKAAKQIGVPAAALEAMKPWLAGLTIAVSPLLKAGFDPKLGVDKQIQAQMEKAGKPVKGLETAKEQIQFLAKLPESVQLDLLRQTLHDYAHAKTELLAIIHAWKQGKVEKLAHLVDDPMKKRSPTLYKTLLVNRNRTWAHKIAGMMKHAHGTLFIAVGAGHLAGPDRVQAQLQQLGIHATRISD